MRGAAMGAFDALLRYINRIPCKAAGGSGFHGTSASFYYFLGVCGSAAHHYCCNAPNIA